jgi:hypothetical protein
MILECMVRTLNDQVVQAQLALLFAPRNVRKTERKHVYISFFPPVASRVLQRHYTNGYRDYSRQTNQVFFLKKSINPWSEITV